MDAVLQVLTAIGVFLGGLLVRMGIVVAFVAALVLPVALGIWTFRGFRWATMRAQGYRPAGLFRFCSGLFYAPGHTWLRPEGSRLRIGLDDLAQRLFPWAVSIELPVAGRKVVAGEPIARISAGRLEGSVAAPVSGTVVALNPAVARNPALLKSNCYGRGWLFAIEPDGRDWRSLPTGETALGWLRAEGTRLAQFCEQQFGTAATDGGTFLAPPPTLLNDQQWKDLTRAFLLT